MIVVNGKELEWEEGMTVRRMLEKMKYTSHLILVKVDDEIVPQDRFGEAIISDGAKVDAIHLVGGG